MTQTYLSERLTSYLDSSRGINLQSLHELPEYQATHQRYQYSLVPYNDITPGCIDARKQEVADGTSVTTGSPVCRPALAGGSAFFLIALGMVSGLTYKKAFTTARAICKTVGWRMSGHTDDSKGDCGCGFAYNMGTVLEQSIKRLADQGYHCVQNIDMAELHTRIPDAPALVEDLRSLPKTEKLILNALGNHNIPAATMLFVACERGKTVDRNELFDELPTFTVNMADICDKKVYQAIQKEIGPSFQMSYEEFVDVFIEIHLSTFTLLGVFEDTRNNLFVC